MNARTETAGTALLLPGPLRAQLERWAGDAYPDEACGLVLGNRRGELTDAVYVRRARNLCRERARDRYELDPIDHLAAEDDARANGLDVVGIWHSHPDNPARPSETDRARAWNDWSYVIVAVAGRAVHEVRSWRLQGERFIEEDLVA